MKNTNTFIVKHMSLLILGIILGHGMVMAQVSKTKHLSKGFKIDKSTIVDIGNKYGDITINTWNKDSVYVEITYEVQEKNQEKLNKKLEELNFELTQSGHYLVINTVISGNKNMFISELSKFKETIGVGESQVKISMNIKLPNKLDLRIKNKFGNIYLDDYAGDVSIDLANGRLKAHNLSGYVNMKLNFGDAIINNIDSGNLEIYYSEMNLATARKLRITSKTSDITITEAVQLHVNSSRDDYRIRMISDFETQSNWTDFSISEFKQKSDIRMNYGDLTIEKIQPSMENITIDAKSTKISLFFDKDMDVNFDIVTNRDLNLPMEATIDSTNQIDEKEKIIRYIGRTGNVKISTPKLILKTISADITILKR